MDKRLAETLTLLLYSFRPLCILELKDVERFQDTNSSTELDSIVSHGLRLRFPSSLGSLLRLRRNEVHFAHPSLREFLLSGTFTSKSLAAQAHQEITELCLKYISSPTAGSIMKNQSRLDGTVLESRDKFLSYAVRYWLNHAKLSKSEQLLNSAQVQEFLADYTLLNSWAERYWDLSNPFTRGNASRGNPFAILASHGLEGVLNHAMDKHKAQLSPFFYKSFYTLEAAASSAEIKIVRSLLVTFFREDENLDRTILGAIRSGDEQNAIELVEFGLESSAKIKDPALLLCRASLADQSAVVKLLISLTTRRDMKTSTVQGMSALQHARIRDNAETVKILLGYDNIFFESADGQIAQQLACIYSRPEIVALITEAEIIRVCMVNPSNLLFNLENIALWKAS